MWTIGIILVLLVLLLVSLQFKGVQQLVARQVEQIAENSLGTDVGIGSLDIDFPSRVQLYDLYVNNPEGDSIARIGHLGVGINMFGLFSKKVEITEVILHDVYANIITTDSTSNIQFLLDQATPDSTGTAGSGQKTPVDTTAAGGFSVAAAGARLELKGAVIYYQDDPAGILADVDAQLLEARLNDLDLDAQCYDIDYLDLEGVNALIGIGESTATKDTTTNTTAAMELLAGRISIKKSSFDLQLPGQEIETDLPYVNLEGAALQLGDKLIFNSEVFQLREATFALDAEVPKLQGSGIDYNHLHVTDITAEATDIAYITDSLHLRLRQLEGKERSGLAIKRAEGTIEYDPNFLMLKNFLLRTNHTEINSADTQINYNFASGKPENARAGIQLDGYVGLADVALLAPDLLEQPVIKNNLKQRASFNIRAAGTMANLKLRRVQLDGPGVKVRASGNVQNLSDPNRISGELDLKEFSVVPGPLLPLVPDGMLPPDIDWPQKVVAEGRATYRGDRLQLNLYALENRRLGNGQLSRVRTNGVIEGLKTFPKSSLNLELDTLLATKATILAYVPPGTIPEDYQLPDFLRGSGTVSGPMDDLSVNLRLSLPGEATYASINGNIQNVLEPERLNLDLQIADLAINIKDVTEILPDSTLPANVIIPDLRIREARVSGSLDNLTFDIPLETDNGTWRIDGRYNPQDISLNVDVTEVMVPDLFTGALSDTLRNLELGPLNISARVTGALEPVLNLNVNARIGQTGGDQILDLAARVEDGSYTAEFEVTHPEFNATGEGTYAVGTDSIADVEALVDINSWNLEYWEITQVPFNVKGRITARSQGLDPYQMIAFARLDSVALRGAEGSSYIDSMVINASLVDRENEVTISSDVLDAELLGRFDPLKTPEKLLTFIMAYWDESLRQSNPVENGESLDFALDLKRPQPLTGGLITGLNKLSPFKASLLYREQSPQLLVNLDLAEIEYAGLTAHDLQFRTVGDQELLTWEANWSDIEYGDGIALGKTVLSGETVDDEMLVELKLYAESDSLRHYLGFAIDQEESELSIELEPEQLLNFETWTVPLDNLITYDLDGPTLEIDNLIFGHQGQLLEARTTQPNDIFIHVEDFDLRTPSRLLYSEEEFLGGIVNGEIELDNVLTNLGIQSDVQVEGLKYLGTRLGHVFAKVSSPDEQTYNVKLKVREAGNEADVTGKVMLDGPIDLLLDVQRLQLASAEPFSLGYLRDSEGYLTGKINVGGTLEAPTLNGDLSFQESSIIISLLGERFRLDEQPIKFGGRTVSFGNNWRIFDSEGGAARVDGNIKLNSLTEIDLNLDVSANDFLAINSTAEQNEDWYGKMFVDAEVEIRGTAIRPLVAVKATTSKDSEVTYVYRIAQQGLVESADVVVFEEQFRWRDMLRREELPDDSLVVETTGLDVVLDLEVDPELEVTVVVDPVSGQNFVGKANGELSMHIYPDGRQEATGQIVLVEGKYDFIYQNIINKEFQIVPGSKVTFTGDLINPLMDLKIRHLVKTSPLPLVQGVEGESTDVAGLRRQQTFFVDITIDGELGAYNLSTDVTYPADAYGNLGLAPVTQALATLRQDQSRMTTTAFQLLAFGSFNIPGLEGGGGGTNLAATTITGVMDNYLNGLADQLVGFVDLDFGLNNYQDEGGVTQTNLRVSLRKTFFDDRVIISVDGVAGTAADELAGTQQTYLDNITLEYLINEDGTFRVKFFNDRERNTLVGGNVIRFGGRLTFGKDFESLGWNKSNR